MPSSPSGYWLHHVEDNTMTTVVIVAAVLLVAGVVAWFLLARRHPEYAASHHDPVAETTSDQIYGDADRPAGPDAEPMDPDRLEGDLRPPLA
jgi:hypothetical protein